MTPTDRKRLDPSKVHSEAITGNFTPSEFDLIRTQAKKRNISLAKFVRDAAVKEAEGKG